MGQAQNYVDIHQCLHLLGLLCQVMSSSVILFEINPFKRDQRKEKGALPQARTFGEDPHVQDQANFLAKPNFM
ncbi:UNVERIFIED_CONTAM: hypothetical protein NCL1_45771 [Trichonephila clavipes]